MQNLTVVGFSILLMALSGELLIRYFIPAWPFEPAPYVPEYLTVRDIPLAGDFHPQRDEIV